MMSQNKAMFIQLTKVLFAAQVVKLPEKWQDPGDQYDDAFKPGEKVAAPNSPLNLPSSSRT